MGKTMLRYPIIIARRWIEDVNVFMRSLGTRLIRKTVEAVLHNLDLMSRMQDLFSSVEFERQYLKEVPAFKTRHDLFKFALAQADVRDGLYLEFGVYKGDSINRLARLAPDRVLYGFDSFEGLPESWTIGARRGSFSLRGRLPAVRNNVKLVKGFFEDTLGAFVAQAPEQPVAFMHVDCDLYSATRTVLAHFAPRLVDGTVIVFDEYFNYPGWQEGEFKAFTEFIAAQDRLAYRPIGYIRNGGQVAVRLSTRPDPGGARAVDRA